MRLTVFNGSPRGKGSNTRVFLEHFLEGFVKTPGNTYELIYLLGGKDPARLSDAFARAETVLLAFPLYVDCMPAMIKDFIEALESYCGRDANPPILFMIQSGFPEAIHLRALERYLEKLSRRLGCRYLGTIVKGGGESIRFMPKYIVKNIFARFCKLGRSFGVTGRLDKDILSQLASPELMSKPGLLIFKILKMLGRVDAYWDKMFNENKTFGKRFDAPYQL